MSNEKSPATPPIGQIRLLGCGGFGTNIASKFETSATDKAEIGYAQVRPVYLDTSRANLHAGLNPELFASIEGLDGSGGIRKDNHEAIAKSIKNMLQTHKPLDFNIVVFSGSGGSGSVFGPLVIAELLARGLPVVALVVGSDESAIRADNTLKTLQTLERQAELKQLPVVMYYDHNDRTSTRSEVDAGFLKVIGQLGILASRQNAELDSRDVINWVQFSKHTNVKPRLSILEVYDSNSAVEELQNVISVASLYNSPDAPVMSVVPDYHTAGYPRYCPENLEVLHYAITVDAVQIVVKKLHAVIDDIDAKRQSRVVHNSIVGDAVATDDGMIL